MSGFNYKPIWYQPTARGGAMALRERQSRIIQEAYEEETIGTSGMTRKEREAIEKDRLKELQFAQPHPADYHGYTSDHYIPPYSATQRFAHSDPYGHGFTSYRPPTGWNYETDTPTISYYSYFGEPSLEELDKGNAEIDELLESNQWSPQEEKQILDLKERWNAGEISPFSLQVKDMYADANIKWREEREDKLEEAGFSDYSSYQATSLDSAKWMADKAYFNYLENKKKDATGNELKYLNELISEGAPDFNTKEEILRYYEAGDDDHFKIAADLQKFVVQDFLDRSDNTVFEMKDYSTADGGYQIGNSNTIRDITMNTGTILGAPNPYQDVVTIGDFGTYGSYSYSMPEQSTFGKIVDTGLKVLSVVQPQLAPVIAGVQALAVGGDLEDALKSAGTSWVTGKIASEVAEIAEPDIAKAFDSVGIDVYKLPESVQNVVFDTTYDVLDGDSLEDSLKKNAAGEILAPVGDYAEEIVKDMGEAIPELVKEGINVVADTFEPAVDLIDSGLDFIGDEFVDPLLSTVGEVTQPFSNVTSDIEDVVLEGGRVFDDEVIQPTLRFGKEVVNTIADVGEPLVDAIDDALDTFGEEVVDPALQAGSDILSEGEDILKEGGRWFDDLINWDSLAGGMLGGAGGSTKLAKKTPTATESLFDKELFKFDTEIEATQKLLSPMKNLRKYG